MPDLLFMTGRTFKKRNSRVWHLSLELIDYRMNNVENSTQIGWLVSALTSALQPNIFIVFRKPRASVLRNDKTLVNSPSSKSEKSSPTWEAPKKLQDKVKILSVHVRYSTKPSIYAWRKQSPLTCSKVDSRTSRSYKLPVARPEEQGEDYSRN